MKKTITITSVVLLLAVIVATAVDWKTYTETKYNIKFKLPADWAIEAIESEDTPSLYATNPAEDIALIGWVYKDADISTEELLNEAIEELTFEVQGEAEETEINGMLAWVGAGAGVIDGEPVGIALMVATHKDNNYVVYMFTHPDAFEDYIDLMEEIITSFTPL